MPQTSEELVNEYMNYRDDTPDAPFVEPTSNHTRKVVKRLSVSRRASGGLFSEPFTVAETVTNPNQFELVDGMKLRSKEFAWKVYTLRKQFMGSGWNLHLGREVFPVKDVNKLYERLERV